MKKQDNTDIIKERSKQYGSRLWELIRTQVEKHSALPEQKGELAIPPKKVTEHRWLMNLLFVVPYLLLGVFIISFFWDFNGMSAELFGHTFSFEGLLRIISISGLIGFLTNWLAITMLFRPTHKRPILGRVLFPLRKTVLLTGWHVQSPKT
ncbi:hypothetical protein [Gracilimonas sp. BCB1]|uniref:hypothetical protein n=1 Tax=Gracilimonas sp. BCB1 TaxID=3152362 RepID=UPI003F8583B5